MPIREPTSAARRRPHHLAGEKEEKYAGRVYAPDPDDVRSSDEAQVVGRLGRMCGPDYNAQNEMLGTLLARARALVDDYWSEIDALASALPERRTMTGRRGGRCHGWGQRKSLTGGALSMVQEHIGASRKHMPARESMSRTVSQTQQNCALLRTTQTG